MWNSASNTTLSKGLLTVCLSNLFVYALLSFFVFLNAWHTKEVSENCLNLLLVIIQATLVNILVFWFFNFLLATIFVYTIWATKKSSSNTIFYAFYFLLLGLWIGYLCSMPIVQVCASAISIDVHVFNFLKVAYMAIALGLFCSVLFVERQSRKEIEKVPTTVETVKRSIKLSYRLCKRTYRVSAVPIAWVIGSLFSFLFLLPVFPSRKYVKWAKQISYLLTVATFPIVSFSLVTYIPREVSTGNVHVTYRCKIHELAPSPSRLDYLYHVKVLFDVPEDETETAFVNYLRRLRNFYAQGSDATVLILDSKKPRKYVCTRYASVVHIPILVPCFLSHGKVIETIIAKGLDVKLKERVKLKLVSLEEMAEREGRRIGIPRKLKDTLFALQRIVRNLSEKGPYFINMSFGTKHPLAQFGDDTLLAKVLMKADRTGARVFVSAGNRLRKHKLEDLPPAKALGFLLKNVYTVGGQPFQIGEIECPTILNVTWKDGTRAMVTGTSFAAPQALTFSLNLMAKSLKESAPSKNHRKIKIDQRHAEALPFKKFVK